VAGIKGKAAVDIQWSQGDDDSMVRGFVLASLLFVVPCLASGQALSVLHVRVVLADAERKATPVPRHVLLLSDNPATAPPRRIITGPDGTADVRLRAGNYTVESDKPVAFQGRAYQWIQTVDIVAGRDAVLALTADNAQVEPLTSAATASSPPLESDPSAVLMRWHDSVVGLWTPTAHASGFLVDAKGLIATNQRVVGTATSVEVQLTPAVKVAGHVLEADPMRDVAIIRVDPTLFAAVQPVALGCALPAKPPLVEGQEIFTIGDPLREQKGMTPGAVSRVEPHATVSDFILARGSTGGPVFVADGGVVGITSIVVGEKDESRRGDSRVVPISDVCGVLASVEKKMTAAPPSGTHLPVEPVRPFPVGALQDAAHRRVGNLSPYQMPSSDFDIAFITPVLAYGALEPPEPPSRRQPISGPRTRDAAQSFVRPLMDFANWSDYVADFPPVLLVRVTPKLVEGFWTTVARGAARTQGVALPPIKHFKSGFSRMRAFCGDVEVAPIHPFKLEQRVSDGDAIYEGLYVYDPGALGPQCGTVKLTVYSEKEPEKGDTRVVDPKVVQEIWEDFAAYRALK
jgi:S1-C subfamily serine protease